MYDDIENISRKFHRHRLYYKLADFILFFLLLYIISYYLNVVTFFSGYMEYYVLGTVSLDQIIVLGVSVLASSVLVIILYLTKSNIDTIEMVESRYGLLKERLRTAWDCRDEDNVVATDLVAQVTIRLREVDVGSFLDRRYLAGRLLISVVLMAALIGLSASDIQSNFTPEDITTIIEELGTEIPETLTDPEKSQAGGLDDEIFGETSVASIEGENVELVIIPGLGTAVTIRHAGEEEDIQFVPSQTYPVDMVASTAADESYMAIQQMSTGDKDLIMEYAVHHSKLLSNYSS
ncbi:MAG: hypothetical protein KAR85_01155 [Methanosarcinales archaeon]|nr:hypothetical protein [Methanosarcinales archaeon]